MSTRDHPLSVQDMVEATGFRGKQVERWIESGLLIPEYREGAPYFSSDDVEHIFTIIRNNAAPPMEGEPISGGLISDAVRINEQTLRNVRKTLGAILRAYGESEDVQAVIARIDHILQKIDERKGE